MDNLYELYLLIFSWALGLMLLVVVLGMITMFVVIANLLRKEGQEWHKMSKALELYEKHKE